MKQNKIKAQVESIFFKVQLDILGKTLYFWEVHLKILINMWPELSLAWRHE